MRHTKADPRSTLKNMVTLLNRWLVEAMKIFRDVSGRCSSSLLCIVSKASLKRQDFKKEGVLTTMRS